MENQFILLGQMNGISHPNSLGNVLWFVAPVWNSNLSQNDQKWKVLVQAYTTSVGLRDTNGCQVTVSIWPVISRQLHHF